MHDRPGANDARRASRHHARVRRVVASSLFLAGCCFGGGTPPPPPPAPVASAPVLPPPVLPPPVVAPTTPLPSAPITDPAQLRAVLDRRGLELGGYVFGPTPTLAEFRAVLGAPDRTVDLANRIHTYDRLGIILYEPYDGHVSAANVYFARSDLEFGPRETYRGTATIVGTAVTGATPVAALALLPGATYDSMFDEYDLELGACSLILEHRNGESTLAEIAIQFQDAPVAPTAGGAPARHPLEPMCLAGRAEICTDVALAYQAGIGVPEDATQAARFARLGCDGGDGMACFTLAVLTESGDGVPASHAESQRLMRRACSLGTELACELAR
jgi:hypothetical protein